MKNFDFEIFAFFVNHVLESSCRNMLSLIEACHLLTRAQVVAEAISLPRISYLVLSPYLTLTNLYWLPAGRECRILTPHTMPARNCIMLSYLRCQSHQYYQTSKCQPRNFTQNPITTIRITTLAKRNIKRLRFRQSPTPPHQ